MSKITQEQAEYITQLVYARHSDKDTDDNWNSKSDDFEIDKSDLAYAAWGWLIVEVEFGLKSWQRGDDASFLVDFDYIAIINNKQDFEDGEKSIELHGKECVICNIN